MIPQTLGLVIPKEKLIALGNARKYHARKRSLADIHTRKALHLGLSHLKTHSEVGKLVSQAEPLELNCLPLKGVKGAPIPVLKAVKSQPNSVDRVMNEAGDWRGMRANSTSALPIAVLNLVPAKSFTRHVKLPKIHREMIERREGSIGNLTQEETKEGPFSVVSFTQRPLIFLEDHNKRLLMPPLARGRLKRLLSIPAADLQDNSLLGVFPRRRVGINLL
jgi:hypothetical protein